MGKGREIRVYDYVNRRIIPFLNHANVFVVRYERWFRDARALLDELGAFVGVGIDDPLVAIRPPRSGGSFALSDREMGLIRDHCTTAAALGYEL